MDKKGVLYKDLRNIYDEMMSGERIKDISLAKEWLNQHDKYCCWIDGEYVESVSYQTIKYNFNIEVQVAEGVDAVERAVKSAALAQKEWQKMTLKMRLEYLYKISSSLQAQRKLFSELCYVLRKKNEFDLFLDYFNFYSDMIIDDYQDWKPLGTVVVVLSSKAPSWVLAMNVAAALSTGCSVIVKPSNKDLFLPFLLAEISAKAGLSCGLLNIVSGSSITTDKLCASNIAKVVFNGSYKIGSNLSLKFPDKYFSILSPIRRMVIKIVYEKLPIPIFKYLPYFPPNNVNTHHTASIILDPCDVNAAADKILSETSDSRYISIWDVGLIAIQEAVCPVFLLILIQKKIAMGNKELKFCDITTENLKKIVMEAARMGVKIPEYLKDENSDTVWDSLVYTNRSGNNDDTYEFVVKLLLFRTAKEAIYMVNNSPHCLGVSVWCENTTNGLKVASELKSSFVWINCHGLTDPRITFEPLLNSGTGSFGGVVGALSYMTPVQLQESSEPYRDPVGDDIICDREFLHKIVKTAESGYKKWKSNNNRKKYLKDIYYSVEGTYEELYESEKIINFWAHNSCTFTTEKGSERQDLYVTQSTNSVGVIVVVLLELYDVTAFVSIISPAIALGNVVIIVADELSFTHSSTIINVFQESLPKGVFNMVKGIDSAYFLTTEPGVDAVWVTSGLPISPKVQKLKITALEHFKRFWIPGKDLLADKLIMWNKCLKNQSIWFTKAVDI